MTNKTNEADKKKKKKRFAFLDIIFLYPVAIPVVLISYILFAITHGALWIWICGIVTLYIGIEQLKSKTGMNKYLPA